MLKGCSAVGPAKGRRRSLYAIAYKLRRFGRDRGLSGIGPTGACGLNPRQRGTRGPAGGLNRI